MPTYTWLNLRRKPLDDKCIVWLYGKKAFYGFLDSLNNHEPPIRFKVTLNKQKMYFLDTTTFKDPENKNGLLTKVFFKPTDRHQLWHNDSFHHKHTFQGSLKSHGFLKNLFKNYRF